MVGTWGSVQYSRGVVSGVTKIQTSVGTKFCFYIVFGFVRHLSASSCTHDHENIFIWGFPVAKKSFLGRATFILFLIEKQGAGEQVNVL